ncbi:MAG: branched-chain amino acid aminotransferase [Candidatus Sigynarchaeota archaeon]
MEIQPTTTATGSGGDVQRTIAVDLLPSGKRRSLPDDESTLGFGQQFTDHMFSMKYVEGRGWHDAKICPYSPLVIDPAALVFHYGQEIFEGLKAYRGEDGHVYMFRPDKNIERMNASAKRICMPPIDERLFMEGMIGLVRADIEWVPRSPGTSLYIRPTCIATQAAIGVRASSEYLFYIILSPSGPYFASGFSPIKILVEDSKARATPGGVGDAKAGGNYAASLVATKNAKEKGYAQLLWLDAARHEYIEEAGTMNVFFVINGTLVTPPLNGSILAGITRDSVIQIARDLGMLVDERPVSIHEIVDAWRDGGLDEAFGTGTAAVIIPIGELCFKDTYVTINDGKPGRIARRLYDELAGIQYGTKPDMHGWRVTVT